MTKGKSPAEITTATLQMISLDQPHLSTDQLVQEVNRLKLNPDQETTSQESQPTSPRLKISSTSHRPRLSVSSANVSKFKQSLPAQLLTKKPKKQVKFKRSGQARITKHISSGRNRVAQILRESSGFGTGPSPYETIRKSLTELKDFINRTSSNSLSSGASNLGSTAPGSNSARMLMKVSQVTEMVEEYLNGISSTVSEEEMEEGLLSIQRRVGVDLLPTWYCLLSMSYMAFWESLSDQFECSVLKSRVHEDGDQFGLCSSDHNSL